MKIYKITEASNYLGLLNIIKKELKNTFVSMFKKVDIVFGVLAQTKNLTL